MRIDFQPGRRTLWLLMVVVVAAATVIVVVVVLGSRLFAGRLRAPVFPAHVFGVGQMVVLLVLHPPVLEPYLDLSLR